MELLKQPYEISLWKDELVWHRRKLDIATVSIDTYKRGKYYILKTAGSNPSHDGEINIAGASLYELSLGPYDSKTTYYSLKTRDEDKNNYKEGSIDDISLDPEKNEDWYSDGKIIPQVVFSFFKEIKLCTIGSDTMDSPARCINPKLVQKINGENTLTFNTYYQYIDPITGQKEYNPFNALLTNERKVKLRIGEPARNETDDCCKWYDFIIKSVQENSESKQFTYTCKDQFVNELSKSGFDIELDNELENNMGTIDELGETILEDSDWSLVKGNVLKQYKEEPLYEVVIKSNITATAHDIEGKKDPVSIAGKTIYVFYSDINDKKSQWQFLILPNNETKFKTNDDLVIDKSYTNYIIDVNYNDNNYPDIVAKNGELYRVKLSDSYRGNRLVRQYQTKYDSTVDKYVGVYKKSGEDDEYYGYTESEYKSSGAVLNYVANPNSFTGTAGWQTDGKLLDYTVETRWNSDNEIYESYISFVNKSNAWVMNAGIGGNRSSIGSFEEGQKYVVRLKYKKSLTGQYQTVAPTIKISKYEITNDYYNLTEEIFNFSKTTLGSGTFPSYTNELEEKVVDGKKIYDYRVSEDANYIYMIATCLKSVSETELTNWKNKYALFLSFGNNNNRYYIEDFQLFPYETYEEDNKTRLCVPGGKLFSKVETKYVYYKPNQSWTSIKDLVPSYSAYEDCKDSNGNLVYIQQYRPGATQFTKVRSISAKESNRFNLIQTLCETFECWPIFTVDRNQKTGEILLDEYYRQQKFLTFKEEVGQPNPIGFKYGINSKSIQRTIDSAAIVSKMIVKDNANEFAPNGFCSIARASESPNGENFLINFDQYIRNKLLNLNNVTGDLYLDTNGYIGYYKRLKRLNATRDNKIDTQSGLLNDIARYEAEYTTYKTSYDSAIEEQLVAVQDVKTYTGDDSITNTNFDTKVSSLLKNSYKDDSKLQSYQAKWRQCANVISKHGTSYPIAEQNKISSQEQYDAISNELKEITEQKRALNLQFYKKYSRFIQEGSWIKEDYTDHNLYYLDAESTLHTSAQPKVTYNISVIDVAPLAVQIEYVDFRHYSFKLGDITFIQDEEFFGWSLIDGTTPYKEEIIVSEITTELDSPEKNQIKVQNYKTQFEDLFQRITATTQQAEYHTGEYNRAAGIVEADGTISVTTLENSFTNNSLKLSNARDQSVVWDESGITTTSLTNPSEMVRIISGGVFLSTDGGQSWKTGITGNGINTSYLTSGQINTNEIYIMNGNNAAFRWDNIGLGAYWANQDEEGNIISYNPGKFVRFDHNGLYGVLNDEWVPGNLDDIYENAPFSLTWKGFSLKNNEGSVRISTEKDIQVLQGENERIRIGRLPNLLDPTSSPDYGIRIKNANEETIMETDSNGELWLRNALRVGTTQTSRVEIGYLDAVRAKTNVHEVIRAGDSDNNNDKPFVVYEDGRVVANYIEATGGKIGNMTIESIENFGYEVIITSNKGTSIPKGAQVELTAHLYYNGEEITGDFKYQWYKGQTSIFEETQQNLIVDSIEFENGYVNYSCAITVSQKEE